MILVRDIFHLKFGKAKEAKETFLSGKDIVTKSGFKLGKTMVDLTGRSYTFVMESEFEDLGTYEKVLKEIFAIPEWQKWYQKLVPLVETASREIYTIV